MMNQQSKRARDIALIASLSAFAIVGRILFAPFPNIKPVSSLLILTGAIFGPRIGLAVAVCSTIGSNVFFGHGPWTIWQIIAWGMMGWTSGWLGKWLYEGPVWIRLIWGFGWGFVFGWMMNSWTWWAFYPHTWTAWWVVQAQSAGFDLAHALANVGFLLLGWPLVKPLLRFRNKRMGIRDVKTGIFIFLIISILFQPVTGNTVFAASRSEIQAGLLLAAENPASKPYADAWEMVNEAFRLQISAHKTGSNGYTVPHWNPFSATTDLERELIGLLVWPSSNDKEHKIRLYATILQQTMTEEGLFADRINGNGKTLLNAHIYGVLALYASGYSLNEKQTAAAIRYLRSHQRENGSFYWSTDPSSQNESDPDMTAAALIAADLLGVSKSDPMITKAWSKIRQWQNENGGFLAPSKENANTNAMIIQAMVAWDESLSDWKNTSGKTPLDALNRFRMPDGSFSYQLNGRSNPMATMQSQLALDTIRYQQTVFHWLRKNNQSSKHRTKPLFKDVKANHPAYAAITTATFYKWMPEIKTGIWRPDQKLSNRELAMILDRIQRGAGKKIYSSKFVKPDAPAGTKTLVQILQTLSPSSLKLPKANKPLTRADTAKLLFQWSRSIKQ